MQRDDRHNQRSREYHAHNDTQSACQPCASAALMVAAGDGSEMVNYRIRGDYYIVDKLFDQAVLVSGVGREQDRVSIRYTGGAR